MATVRGIVGLEFMESGGENTTEFPSALMQIRERKIGALRTFQSADPCGASAREDQSAWFFSSRRRHRLCENSDDKKSDALKWRLSRFYFCRECFDGHFQPVFRRVRSFHTVWAGGGLISLASSGFWVRCQRAPRCEKPPAASSSSSSFSSPSSESSEKSRTRTRTTLPADFSHILGRRRHSKSGEQNVKRAIRPPPAGVGKIRDIGSGLGLDACV